MPLYDFIIAAGDLLWGGVWRGRQVLPVAPMIVALLGAGAYVMIMLRGIPLRRLIPAARRGWAATQIQGVGQISPLKALATALAGQLGVGKIVGVATAITLGGPGAVFWMWATALLGTALAFAESTLAVKYRETRPDGSVHGCPMVYIRLALGSRWRWLAVLFSVGALIAALGATALIQSNALVAAVASSTEQLGYQLSPTFASFVLALLVLVVILGGLKSIGAVAEWLTPLMAVGYVAASLLVLALHAAHVPEAFRQIFAQALGLGAVFGGVAGYGTAVALRAGVARGLMSNEAGQGTTPIVHATAQTDDPAAQGALAALGVVIDTLVVCSMTALVILSVPGRFESGAHTVPFAWMSRSLQGGAVTAAAFDAGIPGGHWIVAAAIVLFAFTTLTTWHYYAEQALTELVGSRAVIPFRLAWVIVIFLGGLQPIDLVWRTGDIAIAMMTLPNLVALVVLTYRGQVQAGSCHGTPRTTLRDEAI